MKLGDEQLKMGALAFRKASKAIEPKTPVAAEKLGKGQLRGFFR